MTFIALPALLTNRENKRKIIIVNFGICFNLSKKTLDFVLTSFSSQLFSYGDFYIQFDFIRNLTHARLLGWEA